MNNNKEDDYGIDNKVKMNADAFGVKDTGFQNTKATKFYLPK